MSARIPDSVGKVVILHYVGRFQRLNNDRLVFVNHCSREFVLKLVALNIFSAH
ncbi:hypothetical protein J8V17_22690 [Photorhabdus bodei]|nr:hypothetical protein [Photorhabdus bodei]